MSKQKKISIIFFSLFLLSFVFVFIPAHANASFTIFGDSKTLPGCFASPPTEECTICNVIGMVVGVAKFILGFVGVLALLLFVWGGFGLIISAGNEEAVKKNKGILVGTLVGIIIVFAAWQMVWLVLVTLLTNSETKTMPKTFSGKELKWNGWSNWSAKELCGPPSTDTKTEETKPLPLALRGKECNNTDKKCKPEFTCEKNYYADPINICATKLNSIANGALCYPLKDPNSECISKKCKNKTCQP